MSYTESKNSTSWVWILNIADNNWLGIAEGVLYVGDHAGPKRELDTLNPVGLLPCLERSFLAVSKEIEEREVELFLPRGDLSQRVPLDLLPATAVESQIDYWVLLALDWLFEMDPNNIDLKLLEIIRTAKWTSQESKHRAMKLHRRKEIELPQTKSASKMIGEISVNPLRDLDDAP